MVGTIIYLIIIALIIRKVLKDKKGRTASSSARNKPPAQNRNSTGGNINQRTGLGQANPSPSQTAYQTRQQMRDLKHRLEKKYQSVPRPMKENQKNTYSRNMDYSNQKKDTSILQSAKENVAQNDIDLMKEADRKWHETAKASLPDAGDGTDILKQVYDLIAMGYSGNLRFERDFVSEGMDMINRGGMPEGSVELLDFSVEGKF